MRSHNLPLNIPPLEAAIVMHGGDIPADVQEHILNADYSDDLSGLRLFAHGLQEKDGWSDIQQPKREIADYVESFGFNVPTRYDTLREAIREVQSGKTIFVRSEHPDEYDKFSGLLESYRIDSRTLARAEEPLANRIVQGYDDEDVLHYGKRDSLDELPMRRYLQLTGKKSSDFYNEMSYSFWEYVSGTNIMVAADDAIEDRYHITARNSNDGRNGWICNSDGVPENIEKQYTNIKDFLDEHTLKALIDHYNDIRQLPKFSVRQCPIMEMQLDEEGVIWFLQYHKTRPFRSSSFRLDLDDYPASDGWIKAQSVRGALGSFVSLKAAHTYPPFDRRTRLPAFIPDGPEEASFDVHGYVDLGFTEFAARTRTASLLSKSHQQAYMDMADGVHELRSRWFKPSAAMSLGGANYDALISPEKRKQLGNDVYEHHMMGHFALNLASDGLTGFVRLDPDTLEQPVTYYYQSPIISR